MRTIAAVIGALGIAAAVAAAVPAQADSYFHGTRHVREPAPRTQLWHGYHRWTPVHYAYRHYDRHHRHDMRPYRPYR